MDSRVKNFAAGQQVASADLNNWQDQTAALFQLASGFQGRPPALWCKDGTTLKVGPHLRCFVGSTQANTVALPAVSTATIVALPTMTASVWYYVYAYNSGTYAAPATSYEVSATAPESSLSHKAGASTHAFIGAMFATSTTEVRPFWQRSGHCVYRRSAISLSPDGLEVLAAGSATSFTNVDLGDHVPSFGGAAILDIRNTAAVGEVWVRSHSDATAYLIVGNAATPGMRVVTDFDSYDEGATMHRVEYRVTGSGVANLSVAGYRV